MKGRSVETKFEKLSVIQQPNAFKSQRQSVLGKPTTFSDSLTKKDFSKSKSVTINNVSNDLSKPVTAHILPQNVNTVQKNTNMIAPGMTKPPIAVPISTREPKRNVNQSVATPLKKILVEIILFIVDSRCSKHMMGNLKRLTNFVEKFLGTVKFGNDQIAILGYGDLVQGNVTNKRFTCYIRDLKGNDILTGSRGTNLYSIALQDTTSSNPIFLMAKASSSQAWLWHRHLSHLNFDTINLLSKYDIVTGLPKLKFVKDHLCSSCELRKAKQSFNGKKYVLVIVDDYSRYTWTHFLRSKDETPEVLIDFLKLDQRGLPAQVRTVQTDKDGENLDKKKEKGDACLFVGYYTQSRAYMVYNKRTRVIVETIPVNFDELPQMASDYVSSDPVPQCPTTALEQDSLSLGPQSQENVPHAAETITTSNELNLLFSLMFNELLNGTNPVVSKSSAVHVADAPDQRQQQNITPSTSTTVAADTPLLNIQTTPETTSQAPTQAPTVTTTENIHQAKTQEENAQVVEDEFINILYTGT
ncbi:retrovirus-related pol polyprotein from transposon TNT 1-94 [Tanacetum coccineum]